MKKRQQTNLKCKTCGRTICEDSKMKICPDCVNKYGTRTAVLVGGGLILCGKVAWKNKDKIAKGVVEAGRTIISFLKK